MEVNAKARYIRMSVRKIRLVIDVVRGMPVERALAQLRFMKKAAAQPVIKVLASAVANAENNLGADRANLFIKSITADGGPILYRFAPRAFGRAAPIRKRTAHITVILGDRTSAASSAKAGGAKKEEKPAKVAVKKPAARAKKPLKATA